MLNREELEQELQTLLPISLLKDFGLDNKSSPPDFLGILEMLTKRFQFMQDRKDIILFND